MKIGKEATEKLLKGTPNVLEKKGVAILNLKITGTVKFECWITRFKLVFFRYFTRFWW